MGKIFDGIDDSLEAWIDKQPMWFVATAPLAADGRVNVSPRGHDSFSVLGQHRVAWVDYTGSGVETIAHLRENGRICIMFCSFDHRPRIVRLHGTGHVHLPGDAAYDEVVARHPDHPSTRHSIAGVFPSADNQPLPGILPNTGGDPDGESPVVSRESSVGVGCQLAGCLGADWLRTPGLAALTAMLGGGAGYVLGRRRQAQSPRLTTHDSRLTAHHS